MKVKKCAYSGLDVEPSSDLGRSEVWSLASKPPREGKIMQGHQEIPLRSLVTKVVNVGGGQNQETTKTRRQSVKKRTHFVDWYHQFPEEPLPKWIVRVTNLGAVSLVLKAAE